MNENFGWSFSSSKVYLLSNTVNKTRINRTKNKLIDWLFEKRCRRCSMFEVNLFFLFLFREMYISLLVFEKREREREKGREKERERETNSNNNLSIDGLEYVLFFPLCLPAFPRRYVFCSSSPGEKKNRWERRRKRERES